MNMKEKHVYEPPKVEVVVVEPQGVLCGSGSGPAKTGGTTENLDISYF